MLRRLVKIAQGLICFPWSDMGEARKAEKSPNPIRQERGSAAPAEKQMAGALLYLNKGHGPGINLSRQNAVPHILDEWGGAVQINVLSFSSCRLPVVPEADGSIHITHPAAWRHGRRLVLFLDLGYEGFRRQEQGRDRRRILQRRACHLRRVDYPRGH